ncbi:hypothetical protein RW1_014_01890, partial [Rhodococcus wratislaviensis NBRC 100605]
FMEILAVYDLTKSYRAAAGLAGCSHHTVARLVAERDTADVPTPPREKRPMLIDEYLPTECPLTALETPGVEI